MYEVTALVRDWPSSLNYSHDLVKSMITSDIVNTEVFAVQGLSFSETLDLSVEDWVSLYSFCQSSSREDAYSLISLFATVAFGGKINQSLILQLLLVALGA